jgi:DNA-binding XRE family transcriptional regulator
MSTQNSLKKIRESLLMSKAELARKAGISPLTMPELKKECLANWRQKERF